MSTLGDYVMAQVQLAGAKHIFNVPGEYTHELNAVANGSKLEVVGCTSGMAAGHAADIYARLNGIGVLMVTYGVGAYSALNAVACAHAEKSPLVVISGAPGVRERKERPLMSHMVGTYDSQGAIYSNVTCDTCVLSDPGRAAEQLARVLQSAKTRSQPVYIEIPRDMVNRQVSMDVDNANASLPGRSKPSQSLQEAVEAASKYITKASSPVIIVGVEASRLGLEKRIVRMAEEANIPLATTVLGKSAISERHPLSLGVYAGAMSQFRVREAVERADCLVFIGVLQTDINCGFYPEKLTHPNAVVAAVDGTRVRHGHFQNVDLKEFVDGLYATGLGRRSKPQISPLPDAGPWEPVAGKQITANRFFARVAAMLDKDSAIMADIGEALFGTMDIQVHDTHRYFCPAYYGTMGMAIPGTLGLMKACPGIRPIVITGDGSFQMSSLALGSLVAHGLAPIVFVLNNGGYATERMLTEGPWNNIPTWDYPKVVSLFGKGVGHRVATEDQLDRVISDVEGSKHLSVVEVVFPPGDRTDGLCRFAAKGKAGNR